MTNPPMAASRFVLPMILVAIYLAFGAWLYVNQPVILALFSAALALIWLREVSGRFIRNLSRICVPTDS
jgi:hypothetical protein